MRPPIPLDEVGASVAGILPVSEPAEVRREVVSLVLRHRRTFVLLVVLQALAAAAALVGPLVLATVVEGVTTGTATSAQVVRLTAGFAAALVLQTLFTWRARLRGGVLGESVLADLREDFLERAVDLPPGVVERAGTGDLVTRTTTDVDRLNWAVRFGLPEILIAIVTAALVLVALLVTAAPLAVTWLVAVPPILLASRWYFRRAPRAYRAEMASYAAVNATVAETVDAGRTIETYRLGPARVAATDDRIRYWTSWERYTLFLRSVFFPSLESAYVLPLACVLALGGYLYLGDHLTLAQVTAGVLYTQMLIEPVDLILMWYDELQVGQASLARLLGVSKVPPAEGDPGAAPHGDDLEAHAVHFGYRDGHDVLHGVDLDVAPGSRVAVVGPSGAGKSTLGRLLAGVHAPREGTVRLGGADLASLAPEQVRRHVVLVTQEHHVFVGTLRDNLVLAREEASDDDVVAALGAVDADWWADLPDGLSTEVGAGGHRLTPAQAQQVALARLVLADPHTLVLDEATSLLDPRAARHLERSLSAVLKGRTVVAVAHRLHTAHDADTIVVMEHGRVTEHGPHDDLVAREGAYAALWESWRSES